MDSDNYHRKLSHRRVSRPLQYCCLLAVALCCTSIGQWNGAQAAEKATKPAVKVRISQSAVSARSTILWAAQELGLFAKHGVEAEVVYLRSSPIQMTALGTGEVQFAASGGSPVLGAAAAGQDIKIIASPSNRLSYDLVVRPEIKEAKDLRGKRFGITSIGGTVWMAAYLALEHLGLDANRDQIRINAIGNQTILAQAVESGQIDATLLDPFLSRRTKSKGLPVLVELQRAKIPFTNTAWAVSGGYLRERPDAVEAALKAMSEAQAFITAPANRHVVMQIMARHMKLNDLMLLEDGYQDLLVGLERKPYAAVDGLRNIQRIMSTINTNAHRAKVEEIIDNRIVRKLDESGFIDGLYRRS